MAIHKYHFTSYDQNVNNFHVNWYGIANWHWSRLGYINSEYVDKQRAISDSSSHLFWFNPYGNPVSYVEYDDETNVSSYTLAMYHMNPTDKNYTAYLKIDSDELNPEIKIQYSLPQGYYSQDNPHTFVWKFTRKTKQGVPNPVSRVGVGSIYSISQTSYTYLNLRYLGINIKIVTPDNKDTFSYDWALSHGWVPDGWTYKDSESFQNGEWYEIIGKYENIGGYPDVVIYGAPTSQIARDRLGVEINQVHHKTYYENQYNKNSGRGLRMVGREDKHLNGEPYYTLSTELSVFPVAVTADNRWTGRASTYLHNSGTYDYFIEVKLLDQDFGVLYEKEQKLVTQDWTTPLFGSSDMGKSLITLKELPLPYKVNNYKYLDKYINGKEVVYLKVMIYGRNKKDAVAVVYKIKDVFNKSAVPIVENWSKPFWFFFTNAEWVNADGSVRKADEWVKDTHGVYKEGKWLG